MIRSIWFYHYIPHHIDLDRELASHTAIYSQPFFYALYIFRRQKKPSVQIFSWLNSCKTDMLRSQIFRELTGDWRAHFILKLTSLGTRSHRSCLGERCYLAQDLRLNTNPKICKKKRIQAPIWGKFDISVTASKMEILKAPFQIPHKHQRLLVFTVVAFCDLKVSKSLTCAQLQKSSCSDMVELLSTAL